MPLAAPVTIAALPLKSPPSDPPLNSPRLAKPPGREIGLPSPGSARKPSRNRPGRAFSAAARACAGPDKRDTRIASAPNPRGPTHGNAVHEGRRALAGPGEEVSGRAGRDAASPTPPIWLMRQAGRYLPEYRGIRAQGGFVPRFLLRARPRRRRRHCSRSAGSASMQRSCSRTFSSCPMRSGRPSSFESGDGPRLERRSKPRPISRSFTRPRIGRGSRRCSKRCARARAALGTETALIGFCGAPWTVASHMIAGQRHAGSAPCAAVRLSRAQAVRGADRRGSPRSRPTICLRQIEAGAEAVQVLEFLVGHAAAAGIRAMVRRAVRADRRRLRRRSTRRRRSSLSPAARQPHLGRFASIVEGLAAVGLDTAVDPRAAAAAASPPRGPARQSRPAGADRRRTRARRGVTRVVLRSRRRATDRKRLLVISLTALRW